MGSILVKRIAIIFSARPDPPSARPHKAVERLKTEATNKNIPFWCHDAKHTDGGAGSVINYSTNKFYLHLQSMVLNQALGKLEALHLHAPTTSM
jgi:hypothetical protein